VVSVLSYGAETWTLLQSDERRLEAFRVMLESHSRCSLVRFRTKHRHRSAQARTVYSAQFAGYVWRSSDTFDVFLKLLQLTLPWRWSSTHAQAVHLTTEQHGGDLAGGHGTPGCDS